MVLVFGLEVLQDCDFNLPAARGLFSRSKNSVLNRTVQQP